MRWRLPFVMDTAQPAYNYKRERFRQEIRYDIQRAWKIDRKGTHYGCRRMRRRRVCLPNNTLYPRTAGQHRRHRVSIYCNERPGRCSRTVWLFHSAGAAVLSAVDLRFRRRTKGSAFHFVRSVTRSVPADGRLRRQQGTDRAKGIGQSRHSAL